MEGLSDSNNKTINEGFFKYLFDFDDENKNKFMNLFQYTFLSVPFIILFLKIMNYYTPQEDDIKGSLEIIVEIYNIYRRMI